MKNVNMTPKTKHGVAKRVGNEINQMKRVG